MLNQGLTAYNGLQYWQNTSAPINFNQRFTLEGTLKVVSSTYGPNSTGGQRSGYYLGVSDGLGYDFQLGIASGGVTLNTDANDTPTNGTPFTAFNTTDAFHLYRLSVANGKGSLYIDNSLIGSTPIGSSTSTDTNLVFFGDGSYGGSSQTQLRYFQYTAGSVSGVPEPGTIALLLTGAGLFARRHRR